jgi:quinoprotein glucose dehydrogenase
VVVSQVPHPGEFGYDTWPPEAWKYSGGANAWSGLSLDERRGYVYASTGSASYDFYGANRVGDNLFANSVLCLRAATGERVWHFQAVKHDVWDRDFPAPPSLITISHEGRQRDVVAQTAKNGRLYVLDRDTGQPLFPMEQIQTRPSDIDGEKVAPTQILPTLPPPYTRQHFTEDLITNRTPEAEKAVREQWQKMRKGGEFDPPSREGTILFPGMDGGGEWGGTAFDPKSGLLYVNANEWRGRSSSSSARCPTGSRRRARRSTSSIVRRVIVPISQAARRSFPRWWTSANGGTWTRSKASCTTEPAACQGTLSCTLPSRRAIVEYVLTGTSNEVRGDMPTPFDLRFTMDGYVRFTDPDGFPAVTPPWGTLTAIDMNRVAIAWQVPLGEVPGSGLTNTGSENYGGPVVTASGLLFIGATNYDRKFRAFDAHTGTVLWETTLPAAGNATPAVYEVDGKEYVVIGAGGGKGAPSGGTYVAFALR